MDFTKIVQQLQQDVLDVRLTGGEPTLHPNFAAIVGVLESSGLSYSVLTNGFWQKPDEIIRILTEKRRFQGLLISLHGANAEDHDSFVGVAGSFKKVTSNINRATRAGLYVSSNTILNKRTIGRIDEIASLAHSVGATYAVFNRYYGAHPDYAISPEQLRQAAEKITADRIAGRMVRIGNCVPQCLARCDCDGCPAGNFVLTIDPWLRIRPCNHAPLIVGNLTETGLSEIWHGEGMTRWRNSIPSACCNCNFFSQCAAGCRAEALLTGSQADPLIGVNPLPRSEHHEPDVRLCRKQQYSVLCKCREELFGYLLFYEGEVLLGNHASKELLLDLERGMTTEEAAAKHGEDALKMIAELLLRGFLVYQD
jgi:radical SAM protein with 4Fe4S-binding SPASM domain